MVIRCFDWLRFRSCRWPKMFFNGIYNLYSIRQSPNTVFTQIIGRKQTQTRERAHERQRETHTYTQTHKHTNTRGDSPRGLRSRSITSGMRHREPGERTRSPDGWWSSTETPEWKVGRRESEREREKEREEHSYDACRTTRNRGLERCCGFQKVTNILGRTNTDSECKAPFI